MIPWILPAGIKIWVMERGVVINSGRVPYPEAWAIQKKLHALRSKGFIPDTLWLLEHDPVITLGRKGHRENIVVSFDYLKKEGIEVYEVERGGDVTYHGPGQLMGYMFFRIRGLDEVRPFVRKIERAVLGVLHELNIDAETREGYTGVWVGNDKICAIGVAVSNWTTFHGFALYVNPIKEHFDYIIPCGLKGKGVTSIFEQAGIDDMEMVRELVIKHFARVFERDFREMELEEVLAKTEKEVDHVRY